MLKKMAACSIFSMSLLTGCAVGLSPVGTGLITDVKGPISATDEVGSKTGTACANTILGLVNSGDASIATAKANGGISKVATVDYHTQGFYPFVGETCVMITGN